MAKYPNYIPGSNPFNLAGPPTWFQSQLWEFDPSLVVVASKQGFFYRLAQRRPLKLKENLINEILREQADTRMMAMHGLVPITTILATVNWDNPLLFEELRRRAPWRMGGADKFIKMVEDQDWKAHQKLALQQDEHLTHLAKDSWKYYQMQQGLRSSLFSHNSKSPTTAPGTLILPGQSKPYKPEVATTWLDKRSMKDT